MAGLADLLGVLRYGVPTDEKEQLARMGSLPGAPVDRTADQAAADRYASGYLFGKTHPVIAPAVQPFVNRLKTSDLPFFGGSTPELQSQAQAGVNTGANAPDAGALVDMLMTAFRSAR